MIELKAPNDKGEKGDEVDDVVHYNVVCGYLTLKDNIARCVGPDPFARYNFLLSPSGSFVLPFCLAWLPPASRPSSLSVPFASSSSFDEHLHNLLYSLDSAGGESALDDFRRSSIDRSYCTFNGQTRAGCSDACECACTCVYIRVRVAREKERGRRRRRRREKGEQGKRRNGGEARVRKRAKKGNEGEEIRGAIRTYVRRVEVCRCQTLRRM